MKAPSALGKYLDQASTLVGVTLPLAAVVVAAIMTWQRLTTWRDVAILAGMYLLSGLGTTVGFHRMLTHRSFEAHPAARFVLLALGCMAGLSDPVRWASIHIQHHAHSDEDGDPHTPLKGMFHAHMGWFLAGFEDDPQTYGSWLRGDPMVRFFQRSFWYWVALGFIVPYLLGGWTGVLWGGWVRVFLAHHTTFSVNSICHTFGQAPFETGDRSRNQWLVGLLAYGEGWHNNHHAFPRSAFHGLRWWQIDLSGYVIVALERLGLAWNVYRVEPAAQEARRAKTAPAA
ncbi:MAG TPA: acyl-CoA desaturase [Roseiflexaceae bacterium]